MTDSFGLLERLCNLPGVAGFERIHRTVSWRRGRRRWGFRSSGSSNGDPEAASGM